MRFAKVPVNARAVELVHALERVVNGGVRRLARLKGRLGLRARRADYDDEAYAFEGGPQDALRAQHYDKSLRLLWKAEAHAPWSSFRDANPLEHALQEQAERALSPLESQERRRFASAEFRALLRREYTQRERQALVNVLSAVGHGEAYAWLVAADLIGDLHGTGGKAAATAQALEEAKHFVVLRELVQAFGEPVPRLSAWEYLLLEEVLRAQGAEKMFGMNVLVEGIALSLFGALGHLPGLEVLRQFHLDEARHTALPQNYLKAFPLSRRQRLGPGARLRRLRVVLPAVPLIWQLEDDLAELGIDAFEFGGSVLRKTAHLAERVGFTLPIPLGQVTSGLNLAFNAWCKATRPAHAFRDFRASETTRGRGLLAVEQAALA